MIYYKNVDVSPVAIAKRASPCTWNLAKATVCSHCNRQLLPLGTGEIIGLQ